MKVSKHKRTSLVYIACHIKILSAKGEEQITYSSLTYVSISSLTYVSTSSLRHNSSTAYSHRYNFGNVLEMTEFESTCNPICTLSVDGGPHENPKSPKTINVYIQYLKKYDLDIILLSTHALRSLFTILSKKMAPLIKELAGITLLHESCGKNLDPKQGMIDLELEKKEIGNVEEILTEICSNLVLHGYPVVG